MPILPVPPTVPSKLLRLAWAAPSIPTAMESTMVGIAPPIPPQSRSTTSTISTLMAIPLTLQVLSPKIPLAASSPSPPPGTSTSSMSPPTLLPMMDLPMPTVMPIQILRFSSLPPSSFGTSKSLVVSLHLLPSPITLRDRRARQGVDL